MIISYITPKNSPKTKGIDQGDAGPIRKEIQIKTSYIDMSKDKDIVVIPTGERGLGYPVNGVYVVFRWNSNKTVHYLNLAYIR